MKFKDFFVSNKKIVTTVFICVAVIVALISGAVYYYTSCSVGNMDTKIKVYVKGGVKNPGVYELLGDARVKDAVDAAGGVGQNKAALDKINLAEHIQDGDEIYVPGRYNLKPVNINKATISELALIPDMPKWLARSIVEYREALGEFKQKTDILMIPGVLESDFRDIEEYITVK